jgi:hypothetical protein
MLEQSYYFQNFNQSIFVHEFELFGFIGFCDFKSISCENLKFGNIMDVDAERTFIS